MKSDLCGNAAPIQTQGEKDKPFNPVAAIGIVEKKSWSFTDEKAEALAQSEQFEIAAIKQDRRAKGVVTARRLTRPGRPQRP